MEMSKMLEINHLNAKVKDKEIDILKVAEKTIKISYNQLLLLFYCIYLSSKTRHQN